MEKVRTDCYASEKREDYTDSWTGLNKVAPELPIKSQQPLPCDPSLRDVAVRPREGRRLARNPFPVGGKVGTRADSLPPSQVTLSCCSDTRSSSWGQRGRGAELLHLVGQPRGAGRL